MITVAVIVFVTDAIWKSVSASTGSGCSTLVTPQPSRSTMPSCRIPTATPGTWYRDMVSRTRASRRVSTPERVVLAGRPQDRDASLAERDLPHGERELVGDAGRALLDRPADLIEDRIRDRPRGQTADVQAEL